MQFSLNITMDNAAFEDRGELGRILTRLAAKSQDMWLDGSPERGPILDINGNTVGEWAVTE